MKFEFSQNVLNYIEERGSADLTLDLEEIPSNCCFGRLPETRITLASPSKPEGYRHFEAGGIRIHLSRLLRTGDTLKLSLSGLGPFKKIEAAGLNLVL